ncbi:MAG: hypothetical protein K2H09_02015, partial [Treponemataceae bacterium]|nr:hypothetical protein [Treponemataceae bacterium]
MKRLIRTALCGAALLSASCVTMSDYNFRNIDAALSAGDFDAAYGELESNSASIYSSADKALVQLDKGIVSHYAAAYGRSNSELSAAESLMEQYSALSISQAAASVLVNDTIIDYSGDPYEDIYTNIFMALNYLKLGNFDDAFVEIRRFDIKLKEITSQYQAASESQKKQLAADAKSVPAVKLEFHNSALARYLSLLNYRTEGRLDSDRVYYNKIR